MTEQYKIDTVSIILSEMLKESREQNITKGDFHKLPNKYAERIVKLFSIPDVSSSFLQDLWQDGNDLGLDEFKRKYNGLKNDD